MSRAYVTSLCNIIRSTANWIPLQALQKPDPGLSSSPGRQFLTSSEPPFSRWDFSSQAFPGGLSGGPWRPPLCHGFFPEGYSFGG